MKVPKMIHVSLGTLTIPASEAINEIRISRFPARETARGDITRLSTIGPTRGSVIAKTTSDKIYTDSDMQHVARLENATFNPHYGLVPLLYALTKIGALDGEYAAEAVEFIMRRVAEREKTHKDERLADALARVEKAGLKLTKSQARVLNAGGDTDAGRA